MSPDTFPFPLTGPRLRNLRRSYHLSQREFVAAVHAHDPTFSYDRATISYWETETIPIPPHILPILKSFVDAQDHTFRRYDQTFARFTDCSPNTHHS